MSDDGQHAIYRVVDADGEPLWDGIYEDESAAISRRAREMGTHPDGDEVTVEKYELVGHCGAWTRAMSDESYRCTECGMIHDELPDHCDLCYATNDKFFEVLKDG